LLQAQFDVLYPEGFFSNMFTRTHTLLTHWRARTTVVLGAPIVDVGGRNASGDPISRRRAP
jgi:hypothetical protein